LETTDNKVSFYIINVDITKCQLFTITFTITWYQVQNEEYVIQVHFTKSNMTVVSNSTII